MSGIACILHTDGRPVAAQAIAAMTGAMAYRGPDGIDHYVSGSVALGQCTMHATAESRDARLPLASADGLCTIILDGYLANYDELRAELLQHGVHPRNRSDAELVLSAYQVWGQDCPRHIDGEYAFIVWDARQQAVFCARDHQGLRPLLYHWDGSTLVAASDLAGVLAGLDFQPEVDRQFLAELIAHRPMSQHRTVWQGITRVQQAHWLQVSRAGLATAEYWTLNPDVTIRHRRMEDYVEHYRHMLTECVRRAARTDSTLAVEVSGGLDSSAIFALAHVAQQQGRLPAPAWQGYSFLTEQGDNAYEMDFARAVAAWHGQTLCEVPLFLPDSTWFEAIAAADRDLAPFPNMAMSLGLQRKMAADGCRVTLNGQGGDQWLDGMSYSYHELLRSLDLRELVALARDDAAAIGWRQTARRALDFGIRPFVPGKLRQLVRGFTDRGSNAQGNRPPGPQPLAAAMQRHVEEMAAAHERRYARQWHRNYKIAKWREPYIHRIGEGFSRQQARAGIEARSPMFSRAFIEFCAGTPEHTRFRGGIRKLVHRQAMHGLLPEAVLQRTGKAEFSSTYHHHFTMLGDHFARICAGDGMGLLDPVGTRQLFNQFCNAAIDDRFYWDIWGIYVSTLILEQTCQSCSEE